MFFALQRKGRPEQEANMKYEKAIAEIRLLFTNKCIYGENALENFFDRKSNWKFKLFASVNFKLVKIHAEVQCIIRLNEH